MADSCQHEIQIEVGDMPIADPESYEFLGRFDVVQCQDCFAVLSKVPTTHQEERLF